jgi:enoyl-CoA hydratase
MDGNIKESTKMSISEISTQLINVLVTVEDEIALVKINRPKALNALNNDTLSDLNKIFDCIAADDSVRGIIITGEGKGFVAGADIVQMQGYKSI